MKQGAQEERVLFYSLWILLILGIALWRFWPSPSPSSEKVTVAVEMAPEVMPWFTSANIKRRTPSGYRLILELSPEYRASLERGRWVTLGFEFQGPPAPAFRSSTRAHMRPDRPRIKVLLPNPKQVTAQRVRLFLMGSRSIPSKDQMR